MWLVFVSNYHLNIITQVRVSGQIYTISVTFYLISYKRVPLEFRGIVLVIALFLYNLITITLYVLRPQKKPRLKMVNQISLI